MPSASITARAKEVQIAQILKTWCATGAISDFKWNQPNPTAEPIQCKSFRPDFLWETSTGVVIVEVDEEQHTHYDRRCELLRMMEVSLGYGGAPVHWIRYNPDSFKIDGITQKICRGERARRVDILRARLMSALAAPDFENFLTIEYLFYDTPGLPGLTPAGEDIGANNEVQMVRLSDVGAFRMWCTTAGVSID